MLRNEFGGHTVKAKEQGKNLWIYKPHGKRALVTGAARGIGGGFVNAVL